MTTHTPARDAAHPDQAPERPARSTARDRRSTARRGRGSRDASPRRTDVPPVERANGWLVAVAVVAGAILFSVLAMNAFLGR